MSANVKSTAEFHADHRQWHRDVECWSDDIQFWQSEHANAIAQLTGAIEQIRQHAETLDEHADSVLAIEQRLQRHEKSLAAVWQNGTETELDTILNEQHAKQADLHERQQQAHERIKKHHHAVMAKVATLKSALEAAM